MTDFTHFVGIDWTGAKGKRHAGLAVAICETGDAAPKMVPPPSGKAHWGRREIANWLEGEILSGPYGRTLVGIDAAFGYPFDAVEGYLRGDIKAETGLQLWSDVARVCDGSEDYFGGIFADTHARHYRLQKYNKQTRQFDTLEDKDFFEARLRVTEQICIEGKYGPCESVFNLIGASQVGKSALSTMNMLNRLTLNEEICIWPFDTPKDQRLVLVEIYAALFSKLGGGKGKVRSLDVLNNCLAGLGSKPYEGHLPSGSKLDDVTDAVITSAGLRQISVDPKYWHPPALSAMVRRTEGWIFGVV